MKKLIFSSLLSILMVVLCFENSNAQNQQKDSTYNFVKMENPPVYPGGMQKFYQFLGQNIKYPADAIKGRVQGNVYVSFVVEEDGSVADVQVDRKLGAGTDEEAIRVIKLSQRWKPGTVDGKPVRVTYRMPVKFTLARKS